jgi:hypothetical protein
MLQDLSPQSKNAGKLAHVAKGPLVSNRKMLLLCFHQSFQPHDDLVSFFGID